MGTLKRRSPRIRDREDGGNFIDLGGFATAAVAWLVVFVGYLLARLTFVVLQPECAATFDAGLKTGSSSLSEEATKPTSGPTLKPLSVSASIQASESDLVLGALSNVVKPPPASGESAAPEFPKGAKFPPQCTPEQLSVLAAQLSPEGCIARQHTPWMHKECPFSHKTLCGTANPHWFYDFVHEHSSSDDDGFRGILVGCNKGYEAVELLRIVSPSSENKAFDLQTWKTEFSRGLSDDEFDGGIGCPADEKATSNTGINTEKVHVYCIDGLPKTVAQLKKTKEALGYGDELIVTQLVVGAYHMTEGIKVRSTDKIGDMGVGHYHWNKVCKKHPETCETVEESTIDTFVKSQSALKATASDKDTGLNTAPLIHYMSITAEGSDFEILQGAARNLGRIQYIAFSYHYHWRWGEKNFKELIYRLKKKGFVCYFTGSDGQDMWRVTDCWQEHYDIKFPASVGCVNANIPAAEPLLDKMEAMFLQTLEKTS
jgi:hypothetical protein